MPWLRCSLNTTRDGALLIIKEKLQWLVELEQLIQQGLVVGMKVETESEGLSWDEIVGPRLIAMSTRLPFFVKIGGAEAITDIRNASHHLVDEVIGPMIETPFALSKFLQACDLHGQGLGRRVLIESKTGLDNLEEILDGSKGVVSGINFGRSDLAASMSLRQDHPLKPDSVEIMSLVQSAILRARKLGFETTVGGKVTQASLIKLKEEAKVFPDRFETRRFIFDAKTALANPSVLFRILTVEMHMIKMQVTSSNRRALNTSIYYGELKSRLDPDQERAKTL